MRSKSDGIRNSSDGNEIVQESFAIVMMASDEGLTACAVMVTVKAVVLMTCVKMLMACGVVLKTCAIVLMAYTKAMTAFAIRNRGNGMCYSADVRSNSDVDMLLTIVCFSAASICRFWRSS